jgi:hypothetical protein
MLRADRSTPANENQPAYPGMRLNCPLRHAKVLNLLTTNTYLVEVAPGRVPGTAEPKGKDLCP